MSVASTRSNSKHPTGFICPGPGGAGGGPVKKFVTVQTTSLDPPPDDSWIISAVVISVG
jgi:hypothetical protein